MSSKAKPNSALAALAKVQITEPSVTPLPSLPAAAPAQPARQRARVPQKLLSKPTAFNLYPQDNAKIEDVVSFLRQRGCATVSKSRVVQAALSLLELDERTVAAFNSLPDLRDKSTVS